MHGATFREPKIVYLSKAEREGELLHTQKEFSLTIIRVLITELHTDFIHIYETMFHLWMKLGECRSMKE